MVAFRAADASAVDAFHGAGINAGGTDKAHRVPDRATETAITAPIFAIRPTGSRRLSRRCRGLIRRMQRWRTDMVTFVAHRTDRVQTVTRLAD